MPVIVQGFIRHHAEKSGKKIGGLTPSAMDALARYHWSGNVRELRNAIEYAFVLCSGGTIDVSHLPPKIGGVQTAGSPVKVSGPGKEGEKVQLVSMLRQIGGNQAKAARLLGITQGAKRGRTPGGLTAPSRP